MGPCHLRVPVCECHCTEVGGDDRQALHVAAFPCKVGRLEVERPSAFALVLPVSRQREPGKRPRDHGSVFAGASELEALLGPPLHSVVVARFGRHERRPVQELAPVEGGVFLGRLDRMHEVAESLAKESAHGEEEPGRSGQLNLEALVMLLGPAGRAAEVLQVGVEECEPLPLRRSTQLAVGALREP